MKLFSFLQISIELGDSFQSELFHQVDELGFRDVLLLELFDLQGVGGGKEKDLLVLGHQLYNSGHYHLKVY